MPPRRKYPFQISKDELPKDWAAKTQNGFIPCLKFNADGPMSILYERKPACRAMEGLKTTDLLKVDFLEIRMSPKDKQNYIMTRLENGINVSSKTYHFFGCSTSQLKDHKAFLLHDKSGDTVEDLLNSMGDFKMDSVAKRMKRIGLLFSTTHTIGNLDPKQVDEIEDIEADSGELLTDGCGFVSKSFAKYISTKANIIFRQDRYLPSVFQFRYLGYKGVVALHDNLPQGKKILFRPSMRKFKNAKSTVFGLVRASKPYAFASLNSEHVTLLVELGIKSDILLQKQREYLQFLQSALSNFKDAFELLIYHDKFAQAERLVENGLEAMQPEINSCVREELAKSINKRGEPRVRIVLINSRLLYGIAEPEQRLGRSEVFVRITVNGLPQTLTNGWVLVTRNPCLHPGDFRFLKVVDIKEYHHLVDCIVFSTSPQLKRSHASEMSGGDLDGDEFIVIFDCDLHPKTTFHPYAYPPAKVKVQGGITRKDRVLYFAKFNNCSVGRIKNLYLKWVAEYGAQCQEALKLSALFSACIDGERTEIPDKLLSAPEPSEATDNFIVNRLITEGVEFKKFLTISSLYAVPSQSMPQNLWDSLVFDDCFQGLSSFEVFRFIQRCSHLDEDKKMLLYLGIDFASFSVAERQWSRQVCPQLGPLLLNALYQSQLIQPKTVDHFNLSNLGQWKRLYSSNIPGPALQERISDAMCRFARKLIVIHAGPQLAVSLLFTERFENGLNALNDVSVFSTNHKLFHSHAVLKGYCLDLDQHLLQIYKSGKRNTFIWMSTAVNQNERSKGLVGRVSIDLRRLGNKAENHFDLITKQPLRQVEVFVLASNETRDLEVRHFPIAGTEKGIIAPVAECKAGTMLCREYYIYSEQEWLQSPIAFPELVEVVQHHGELGQMAMDSHKMKELLAQASKYHLSELAIDAMLLFPNFASEAISFLPTLPCLAIPLFLLGLGAQENILQSLLRCLNDRRWGSLALENIFKMIPDIDLVPQLEFFCLGSCISPHSTELREWLTVCHAEDSEVQPEIRAALGVFVDLQCSLQDAFHKQRGPMLTFLHLTQKKDKVGIYVAEKASETAISSRRGDVFHFQAMQPPCNMPDYKCPDFIGVVQDMDDYTILFDFRFTWFPYEIEDVDWQATHLGNVTTSRTMWEALSKDSMPCGPLDCSSDFQLQKNHSLNKSQYNAIEMAIGQKVSLIWGPPGTGKSSTAVNLILCLSERGERVLVAASTHQAVDNLLRKFTEILPSVASHEHIIRCGDINDVDPKCRCWTFDMHPLMKHTDAHRASKVVKKILKEAQIVFSTVTAAGLGALRSDDNFDTVVIDEAGQVTHANTLIATSKARRRVILIGDHQQLNATVHEQSKELKFEQSMFEHLLDVNCPCTMLDVQYRMHPSLIKFSSDHFYGGKISSGESTRQITPLQSFPWRSIHHAVFVNVASGLEKRVNGTSFINEIEAEHVCRQVRSLLEKKECEPEEIGIITGYSAQVQCISRRLSSKSITVRTVDGFQGQERRVIIFSAVRTMKNIGFLKDKNRMNVMFTRAKQGLIVFGREATMKIDPLWKDWIQAHAQISAK